MEDLEINFTIAIGVFFFLSIASFIIYFILRYRKKQKINALREQFLRESFQRELLQSQLEIQEHTFNTISQEIHDNVGQVLSLAKMQLNIIEESEGNDKQMLKEAKENISIAMTDLRDVAKSLSSDRIQTMELDEAVGQEIIRLNKSGVLSASIEVAGQIQTVPTQKKLILFRIIQESLQNIIKHAQATNVFIIFNYRTDALDIVIQDNGKGFDPAERQQVGLGLQNIINRSSLIGGTATINSAVNEGTNITIILPYV